MGKKSEKSEKSEKNVIPKTCNTSVCSAPNVFLIYPCDRILNGPNKHHPLIFIDFIGILTNLLVQEHPSLFFRICSGVGRGSSSVLTRVEGSEFENGKER